MAGRVAQVGDDGARRVAAALQSNRSVVSFDLGSNRISSAGAHALAEALPYCNLTELELSSNHLGTRGATELARALGARSCVLASLNLCRNQLGDGAVEPLCSTLRRDGCALRSLRLARLQRDWRRRGPVGAARCLSIAAMVCAAAPAAILMAGPFRRRIATELLGSKTSVGLISLSLVANEVGAGGANALRQAMVHKEPQVALHRRGPYRT
eukprot:SAG11_NODE_566_length_8482_cov_13.445477_5_plen_212_part_00